MKRYGILITAYDDYQGLLQTDPEYYLTDAISCTVTEQRNGCFDLELTYPINGHDASVLHPLAIVACPPRPGASPEPFRIYEITQVITGLITVKAHHVFYNIEGFVFIPYFGNPSFNQTGITNVITAFNSEIAPYYELINDGITDESSTLTVNEAINAASLLGSGTKSILYTFGGELSYSYNWTTGVCEITLHAHRGTKKDTVITYGVNLVSMQRKQTSENAYSIVYARWQNGSNYSFSDFIPTGTTGLTRIKFLDASRDFDTQPNTAQLNDYCDAWIAANNPTIQNELSVEYVPLENSTTYAHLNVAIIGVAIIDQDQIGDYENTFTNDQLNLCDTATVDASLISVTAEAMCVEVTYNVLTNKYDKVVIGTLQDTIADTIAKLVREE